MFTFIEILLLFDLQFLSFTLLLFHVCISLPLGPETEEKDFAHDCVIKGSYVEQTVSTLHSAAQGPSVSL
jgi:hypothetical protein